MGREQTAKRKFFFLYIAGCLIIVLIGSLACRHLPNSRQSKHDIEEARRAISNRDFEVALKTVESILGEVPQSRPDEALYLKGLIHIHPKNPKMSQAKSLDSFQLLVQKYPDSQWGRIAEVWISVLKEMGHSIEKIAQLEKTNAEKQTKIEILQTQIDALKKIDLGTEEKKRRQLSQ